MEVKVKYTDALMGDARNPRSCMVARALKREGFLDVTVTYDEINYRDPETSEFRRASVHRDVSRKIQRFDFPLIGRFLVRPFTVILPNFNEIKAERSTILRDRIKQLNERFFSGSEAVERIMESQRPHNGLDTPESEKWNIPAPSPAVAPPVQAPVEAPSETPVEEPALV